MFSLCSILVLSVVMLKIWLGVLLVSRCMCRLMMVGVR